MPEYQRGVTFVTGTIVRSLVLLEGLAMLRVVVDYDGEIFDTDRTVFAKDIGDDCVIKVTGLTESIAVVAIDKHGNESKPFIIKNK